MPHEVRGLDIQTGAPLRVSVDRAILSVSADHAASDVYVAPGLIDLQVNGFAGVDYNSPEAPHDDIARSIDALVSTGVTRFYPTVITGAFADMSRAMANLARAKDTLRLGEVIEGLHIEGPHISPEDGPRGAHPRRWVRAPSVDEFHQWQDAARGNIRLATLAPEWPGSTTYIEALVAAGVTVAIGHTSATGAQIADAVSAGATMSTHLGNAAHALLPRHPNYLWDQLADDRLAASFIVDGVHLPDAFVRAAIRAKGVTRSILVTDASAPACSSPGRYMLGEQEVDLTDNGRVVLAGQDRLAGSALRLDEAIGNVMRTAGLSLSSAVVMATLNPARVGRISGRQQGLVAGDRADLVCFGFDAASCRIRVEETWVSGACVFRRGTT